MTDDVRAGITDAEPCPYLPDREWQSLILDAGEHLTADLHEQMLDRGFRRMGRLLYRPVCPACSACRSMRIDVHEFKPSKSLRRSRSRNADLEVVVQAPEYTEEKRALLERFLDARHEGPMRGEEASMRRFMFAATDHSLEFDYYDPRGRLIGVGLFDLTPNIGSSLYFYFDPEESRRSLGNYSMLFEIEYTQRAGARWFHPGFYVAGCKSMDYKARFRPAEIMDERQEWHPFQV